MDNAAVIAHAAEGQIAIVVESRALELRRRLLGIIDDLDELGSHELVTVKHAAGDESVTFPNGGAILLAAVGAVKHGRLRGYSGRVFATYSALCGLSATDLVDLQLAAATSGHEITVIA